MLMNSLNNDKSPEEDFLRPGSERKEMLWRVKGGQELPGYLPGFWWGSGCSAAACLVDWGCSIVD